MANPRKFSEKIALHNQKQAEETAAFEQILRDVSSATKGSFQQRSDRLHIQQGIMSQQYRGGSLPNLPNQMVPGATGLELQSALQHMESLRGAAGRMDRGTHLRDRGRSQIGPLRNRQFPMEKRADCSPYGSPYLSPPPDTSWRRTNSDSALHTTSMGQVGDMAPGDTTPPMHRRIQEVVGENSMPLPPWDPKKMVQSRPKSCEVPNINIYPSAEQNSQIHIPNNTGSLPDLSILQFPSPLQTPIDVEDQNYAGPQGSPSNLSPTSAHHMNMGPPQHPGGQGPQPQSPVQRRRPNHSGPSPLVLTNNGSQSMRLPLSPPDPSSLPLDPRIRQQYMLSLHLQRQRAGNPRPPPPPHPSHLNQQGIPGHSQAQSRVPPPHRGPVPEVRVTSECDQNESEPSMTQYRNNASETGCQSPTSPLSQSSYSPSQSPGLPPTSWSNSAFEMDAYQLQQQQTNALQHQFEHFNMLHDNQVTSSADSATISSCINHNSASSAIYTAPHSSLNFSQAASHGLTGSQEFHPAASGQQSSPQHHQQQQTPYLSGQPGEATASQLMSMLQAQNHQQSSGNNKIPDIVLTGADELHKHDFAKDLGNAITGMTDSFDTDFFASVPDEELKVGLDPIDFDGLQMLGDPTMVTDPDTENSFRLSFS